MSWSRGAVGRYGVALSVLVLGLVAGCSGDDPPVTPEPTASVSAEPSPSVDVRVAPTRPAEWDQVSVQGAKAVATYFIDLYDYAYATGDLSEWDALSHPDCKFCASVRESVVASLAAGELTEGGYLDVVAARGAEVAPFELYSVDLELSQSRMRTVSQGGDVLSDWTEAADSTANVLVLRDDDRWFIRGVQVEVHE